MKLHVIHNDEVVEVSNKASSLRFVGIEEKLLGGAIDIRVALDASLGVEDEVVVAEAFGKRLNGIRDHAVEPAEAVRSGNPDTGAVAEVEGGQAVKSGCHFLLPRRKSLCDKRAAMLPQTETWGD